MDRSATHFELVFLSVSFLDFIYIRIPKPNNHEKYIIPFDVSGLRAMHGTGKDESTRC
jgi:hypothetical protein